METIIKVTSFTAHQTPEGMRVSGTYSIIDAEGRLIEQNKRYTRVVVNQEISEAIDTVNRWFLGVVESQEAAK